MNRSLVALSGLSSVMLAAWFFLRSSTTLPIQARPQPSPPSAPPQTRMVTPTPRPHSQPSITRGNEFTPAPTLKDQLPQTDLIRDQVRKDPHTPPAAGAEFAMKLANEVERAVESKEAAARLLPDLGACAANRKPGTLVPSIQALCLQAARDLAHAHPELTKDVEEIFKNAEPETAALAGGSED